MKLLSPNNYSFNQASLQEIKDHLLRTDEDYKPPLHTYVDIDQYALKMKQSAHLIEFYDEGKLIGLLASYFNEKIEAIYITNLSLEKNYRGQGLKLVLGMVEVLKSDRKNQEKNDFDVVKEKMMKRIHQQCNDASVVVKQLHTEVRNENRALIRYYEYIGFQVIRTSSTATYLVMEL